jgi:hypothetical protein
MTSRVGIFGSRRRGDEVLRCLGCDTGEQVGRENIVGTRLVAAILDLGSMLVAIRAAIES